VHRSGAAGIDLVRAPVTCPSGNRPVKLMCSHPRGDRWTRSPGSGGYPCILLLALVEPDVAAATQLGSCSHSSVKSVRPSLPNSPLRPRQRSQPARRRHHSLEYHLPTYVCSLRRAQPAKRRARSRRWLGRQRPRCGAFTSRAAAFATKRSQVGGVRWRQ
jgi:hypothetical protein